MANLVALALMPTLHRSYDFLSTPSLTYVGNERSFRASVLASRSGVTRRTLRTPEYFRCQVLFRRVEMRISACKLRMLALAGAALACSSVAPFAIHADDSG